MKVSGADIDAVLVGGGSIIVPDRLAGTKTVVKPTISAQPMPSAPPSQGERHAGTTDQLR